MEKQEFEKKAMDKLNQWYGEFPKRIVHNWFGIGIMYAVVHCEYSAALKNKRNRLEFFRIFSIGDNIEISRDMDIYL